VLFWFELAVDQFAMGADRAGRVRVEGPSLGSNGLGQQNLCGFGRPSETKHEA
jgi:hypothetical protein